jgi:hypothetical protein
LGYRISVENAGDSAITPGPTPLAEVNPKKGRHHPTDPFPQVDQRERNQEEELPNQSKTKGEDYLDLKKLGTLKRAPGRT